VDQAVWYNSNGNPLLTFTCTNTDCSTCQGVVCNAYTLTVSTERATSQNLPTVSDCRYGDTVKMQQRSKSGPFAIREFAVIGKHGESQDDSKDDSQGEITHWYVRYVCTLHDTLTVN
jgi:hypothetical protein